MNTETDSVFEQREQEFIKQKQAFLRIPKSDLEQYHGEFVASRDGQIVDHDHDLATLTNRFFNQYGDVAVYITRVGKPMRINIPAPFIIRRSKA